MGKLLFCIDKTIKQLKVTPNRVAVEAKISPNTVYNMIGNNLSRVHLSTLENLLDAINRIAEEKGIPAEFTIDDIFIYKK